MRKNGERFWANVVVTPIRDDHGHHVGFAKVTRDLTARREAEKTQARLTLAESAANRAEEANRLKDEFLATVSHELRTPLTAMIGWARMLRTQPLEPKAASAIEIIERNAKAQAKIIEDLLDISRIVSGKLRLALAPVDLVPITRDAIEVVRPSATAKDIDIEVEVGEMGLIVGDGERLRQVVWNLLSNAVKFTPAHGKVRLSLERRRIPRSSSRWRTPARASARTSCRTCSHASSRPTRRSPAALEVSGSASPWCGSTSSSCTAAR